MDKKESILKGKWIVRYDPAIFSYRGILESLLDIAEGLKENNVKDEWLEVTFDKRFKENVSRINRISCTRLAEKQNFASLRAKIDHVLLCFPFLSTDKRWQSISLTASAVFLGSSLNNQGFQVKVKKLQLPTSHIERELLGNDLIGFTLFEDLLVEFKDFLEKLMGEEQYRGLLAAGGPLVTLNPWQVTYHLPEINLLVRGEAELILPGILQAIRENNLETLLGYKGLLFHKPGLLIISDFQEINRPKNFDHFDFNLGFLKGEHLANGLEINFSRGCRRGCLFCSKVQGKELRKLPLNKIEALLSGFSAAVEKTVPPDPQAETPAPSLTININDDDILQDIEYTGKVLELLKRYRFKLWGIQGSIGSFFDKRQNLRREVIETIDYREVFVNQQPLLWLGTDSFLGQRGKRLGKLIPPVDAVERLLKDFEDRHILNYHYWISSDQQTTWEEFVQEFLCIFDWQRKFKTFFVLAHSPFLVPYAATPLHRLLTGSADFKKQIKYKKILKSRKETFTFPLVERLETRFPHLNRLLGNERLPGNRQHGFFDFLKQKDYLQAAVTIYNFLKQDRMLCEADGEYETAGTLKKTEIDLEEFIAQLLGRSSTL